jgi:hypothetical protein
MIKQSLNALPTGAFSFQYCISSINSCIAVFIGYLFLTISINLGNLIMVIANNTGHKVAYNKKYNSKPPPSLKHP